MSREGLERYDRESKVLLCMSCEAETPEEAEATRAKHARSLSKERADRYMAWRNRMVHDAATATETFGDDELERYAREEYKK
jgi:ribosomal protein L40E